MQLGAMALRRTIDQSPEETPSLFGDANRLAMLAVFLLLVSRAPLALAQSCAQFGDEFRLAASIGNSHLGYASATDGTRAVVGAYGATIGGAYAAGCALILERAGDSWVQAAMLTADVPESASAFGIAAAIDGDVAVIGARQADSNQRTDAGAAFVFQRQADGTWAQRARLQASDTYAYQNFGVSVAIWNETIFVGAWNGSSSRTDPGAVYVFRRAEGDWTEQQKIVAADAVNKDAFGGSIAVSGGRLIAGAQAAPSGNGNVGGAAYIFEEVAGIWTQVAKLVAPDAGGGDLFGTVVAISGDTAAVSAGADDTSRGTDSGSVRLFDKVGDTWQPAMTLIPTQVNAYFGAGLALDGNALFVGAPGQHTATQLGAGVVFSYTRAGFGAPWTEGIAFTSSPAEYAHSFGASVALHGGALVVGADGYLRTLAAAYVYDAITPPAIARQPESGAICVNHALEISMGLADPAAASYVWQFQAGDGSGGWFLLYDGLNRTSSVNCSAAGATTSTIRITPKSPHASIRFRCMATTPCASYISAIAVLTSVLPADANCDGRVDNFDIDPFVLAIVDPGAYAAAFPACNAKSADANCDGAVDNFDIDPFVVCIVDGCD